MLKKSNFAENFKKIMKHSFKDWVVATRPWSFPASSMPVIVTLAWLFAEDLLQHFWLGLLALVNIIFVHAAGNLWSDYHDYKRGVDNEHTFGVQTLTSGQFKPEEIKRYSLSLQAVAVVMGLLLVCLTGLPLLWIGIAGIALSLCYPPLKYAALGDVLIALCYSFLPMIGTSFIGSGEIQWNVLWLAVPIGLITIAILHSNNVRDIESDKAAGIHTFPILTGRQAGAYIYSFEVLFPYLWLVILCVCGILSWWALFPLISIPLAVKQSKMILDYKKNGVASFANLDELTAKLQMMFSLLLTVGLILSKLIG